MILWISARSQMIPFVSDAPFIILNLFQKREPDRKRDNGALLGFIAFV